jgi:hypothetical protein
LCAAAVTDVEGQLAKQNAADAAAKQQREEEARARLEEQEFQRQKHQRELDAIESTVRELALKKKAILDSQKAAGETGDDNDEEHDEDDDNDDNDASESVQEQQTVSYPFILGSCPPHISF